MKNYKEVKYELGNAENGKAEWQNSQTLRENVSMTDGNAADLNSQFVTTGIQYELIEGHEEVTAGEVKEPAPIHSMASVPIPAAQEPE